MGTKRVGLARTQALVQALARTMTMTGTTLSGLTAVSTTNCSVSGQLKTSGDLALTVQAVTAAGSGQGDAGEIEDGAGPVVNVSAADNAKGVVLPALSGTDAGTVYIIINTVTNKTLEVYPASGDKILPAGNDAGITVAASAGLILIAADGDAWFGFEPAVIAA